MNVTVVEDLDYRDRRLENRLNAVTRHCKIGKVTSKRAVLVPSIFQPIPELLKGWQPKPSLPEKFIWNNTTC